MNTAPDEAIQARVKQLVVGEPLMLFDTVADPTERTNLINDPRHASEADALSRKLLDHMRKTNDPQTDAFTAALATWARANATKSK